MKAFNTNSSLLLKTSLDGTAHLIFWKSLSSLAEDMVQPHQGFGQMNVPVVVWTQQCMLRDVQLMSSQHLRLSPGYIGEFPFFQLRHNIHTQ